MSSNAGVRAGVDEEEAMVIKEFLHLDSSSPAIQSAVTSPELQISDTSPGSSLQLSLSPSPAPSELDLAIEPESEMPWPSGIAWPLARVGAQG
jgi:hypothetical protein